MKKASIEHRVVMQELDGMRAVYHTNFIKWFDFARTKLFREAGVQMEKWEEGGILLPLVVCHCEYQEGARFDDPLKITAEVTEVRGKVITIEYEIENMDTGRVISTGLTKQVFCDADNKSFVLEERYPDVYKALTE
jgi:acyl-CoA thioester hydrolase